jgi:hypothetical protein
VGADVVTAAAPHDGAVAAGGDGGRVAPPVPDGAATPAIGGPAPPCKYAFCESFESYAEGAAPGGGVWTRNASDIVVGSGHVARGQRALHVPGLTGGEHFIRTTKPFPMFGSKMFARMLFWIEKEPIEKPMNSSGNNYHWTTAELSALSGGAGWVMRPIGGFFLGPGNDQLAFSIETRGQGEAARWDSKALLAPHVWHCFEWSIDVSKNEMKVWWNGQEDLKMDWPDPKNPTGSQYTDPRFLFPELKSLSVGMAEYQRTNTPWDVWIDEVVVDSQRIGCN